MKTNNFIEKSFGPIGSPAGLLMFFVGIIASFSTLYGLILSVAGAFIGFTSQSTLIDFDHRRSKYSNNLFGVFRIGKWIVIDDSMKIGIKKSNQVWRAYSRSNRILDIGSEGYIINLCDANQNLIMPLKKVDSIDEARAESETLRQKLRLN